MKRLNSLKWIKKRVERRRECERKRERERDGGVSG